MFEKEVRVENMLTEYDLLVVAFVCFKVLGLIDWSWWMVFIPYYILIATLVLKVLLLGSKKERE